MDKKSPSSRPTPDREPKPFARYYGLAFELVFMNVALIVGGYYLDAFLKSSPVCILASTFLAMAGTIWLLLKSLK